MTVNSTNIPPSDADPSPAGQSSLKGLTMAIGIQPADPGRDPLLGRNIGGVTIEKLIAEGGMGRVYEGLQDSPKRKVAVKVMRPGFVSKETSQRFAMELEILGRLRHPYIAQIYSAGVCDVVGSQVPFFIMEYIPDALPLTRYAKQKMLGIDARIALFQNVCEAVAHGHEQGIVHRDLKPSNILIEATGVPKIIDFGIARTVGDTPEQMTALTELGQLIGTLQYMSPEQIAADPKAIDQRTDVYALGVILYELLTGKPPYEIRHKQILEAAKVVREHKPVSPEKLNRSVRPDLVKITGNCLQKDRDRRYTSAAELAGALGAYLGGKAVPTAASGFRRRFTGAFDNGLRVRAVVRLLSVVLPVIALTAVTWWWTQRSASPVVRKVNLATDFTYDAKGNAVTINGFVGSGPALRVPRMIDGKPVTIIGREAFRDRADIATVELPEHLVTLEEGAFFNCVNLRDVVLPDGLRSINDGVFAGTGISSLRIPASVGSIGNCLYGMKDLRDIQVHPDNQSFAAVDGILYDKMMKTVRRCPPGMTGEVVVPGSVDTIDANAFAECTDLERVILPASVKLIGVGAFSGCKFREPLGDSKSTETDHFVTYTFLPEGVEVNGYQGGGGDIQVPATIAGRPVISVASDAFSGQAGIRSIDLPDSVTSIGNAAFAGCSGVERIAMPSKLLSIGFDAFARCHRLERIAIPPEVSAIVGFAHCFHGCSSLEAVDVDKANPRFSSADGVLYARDGKTLFMCPPGKGGTLEVPAEVVRIAEGAFAGCTKLDAIVIPASVKEIHGGRFSRL